MNVLAALAEAEPAPYWLAGPAPPPTPPAPVGRAALLAADAVRAQLASPASGGGLGDRDGVAMAPPAKLAWGLRRACRTAGVRLHERTPVESIENEHGGRLRLRTPYGSIGAARV